MTKANDLASLLDANGDVVSSALDNVPASDLVNDTTPQLGGTLDLNSNNITGTGNLDVTGTGTMDRLGLGAAAHASAALLLSTTNQHIRLDNGGELGVIELESNGDLNIWAHGDGETINLKTGSGAGADVLSVVGNNVGIGTVSPDETVQVFQTAGSGNNYNEGTLKVGGQTTALGFQFGYHTIGSGRNVITSLNNSGGANQRISIGFGAVNGGGEPTTNVMTLNQAGAVGIGTSSPASNLTVTANSSGSSIVVGDFVNSSSSIAGTGAKLWLSGRGDSSINRGTYIEGIINGTGSRHDLVFATSAFAAAPTEAMRITSVGKVETTGRNFGFHNHGTAVSLADDASIVINAGTAGGGLLAIYETSSGNNALFRVGYCGATNTTIISQGGAGTTAYSETDTDGKICVFGSGHTITIKNRLGATRGFFINMFMAGNSFAG